MEIEIDLSEVYALTRHMEGAKAIIDDELGRAGKDSGMVIMAQAVNEAPVDLGFLKGKIGPPDVSAGGLRVEVTSHAEYSKAVHDGTDAHVIRPKAKKALFWPGAEHPVRKVNHPGTTANPFMKRALDKAKARLFDLYGRAGERIARRVLGA